MKNLKLKAARAASDMSQDELAKAVGVSRQTINAVEKGFYCAFQGTSPQAFPVDRVQGRRNRASGHPESAR
jgi:hypothetical protein